MRRLIYSLVAMTGLAVLPAVAASNGPIDTSQARKDVVVSGKKLRVSPPGDRVQHLSQPDPVTGETP